MLHVGILPHHDRWGDVLHNLRYVVIDEAHVYRGVFGSHVGNVIRRLRRLARLYGAEPRFLLASATIANPDELAVALTGEAATIVETDTSARAQRDIALWNPALLDPELGVRASALSEASLLMAGLVSRGLRTICFAKSRKAAELIHRFTSERVDTATAARLAPYRAGYTPAQRREIERRLMEGELLGVAATDALELGIDIGRLDCAISVGFPGTVASLRQQWGRAGRREHGLAVLIASEDALDQFFMREPESLLERRVEATRLDHANHRILDPHVCAASFEGPIAERDAATLGPEALERAAVLPELEKTPAGFVWKGRDTPAGRFSLRSGDRDSFTIVDATTGSVLGLIERERAYSSVHEGAVYLHLGAQYLVRELDGVSRTAVVEPAARGLVHAGTEGHADGDRRAAATRAVAGVDLHFGRVSVTEQVIAYQRKAIRDGSTLAVIPLILPEVTFQTEAVWFSPDDDLLAGSRGDAEAPRCPARGRARVDLTPPALGDVRPLGYRRALDERPLPDRAADRLRLRRPRGRRRDHRAWVRLLHRLGRGHGTAAPGLPLHEWLSLVRPEPEVRQPERDARQGSSVGSSSTACLRPDRRSCRFSRASFVVMVKSHTTQGRQRGVSGTRVRRSRLVGGDVRVRPSSGIRGVHGGRSRRGRLRERSSTQASSNRRRCDERARA